MELLIKKRVFIYLFYFYIFRFSLAHWNRECAYQTILRYDTQCTFGFEVAEVRHRNINNILQIACWFHRFPESYFMNTRREELQDKITTYTLYLVFIIGCYVCSGTHIGLTLLAIHYIPEAVFNMARIIHCAGKTEIYQHAFLLWAVTFVLARIASKHHDIDRVVRSRSSRHQQDGHGEWEFQPFLHIVCLCTNYKYQTTYTHHQHITIVYWRIRKNSLSRWCDSSCCCCVAFVTCFRYWCLV